MSEKVMIDQDECIGYEACVGICPAVFSFGSVDEFYKMIAKGEQNDCNREYIR